MSKLLLIVPDAALRQLYHELLVKQQLEVIPAATIEDAILLLSVHQFQVILLYLDPLNEKSAKTFLKLRKKIFKWLKAKLIILTAGTDLPGTSLNDHDLLLNPLLLTPDDLVNQVMKLIHPRKISKRQ